MPGLEHNFNDAERNLQRDVRNPHDVKPPREIGGISSFQKPPKEIDNLSEAGSQKQYADDNGKIYRVDNELLPNNSFERNNYIFNTDDLGRTKSVEGKLQTKDHIDRPIISESMKNIGKGFEKDSDDRGHLIADRFNGPGGLGNLVPQDKDFNRVEFNQFEKDLAKEVDKGKEVYVKIDLNYPGNSFRPDSFSVDYSINKEQFNRVFSNETRGDIK